MVHSLIGIREKSTLSENLCGFNWNFELLMNFGKNQIFVTLDNMGCGKSKEIAEDVVQYREKPRRRRPRLDSVVAKQTDSLGYVVYSTPTEGYNLSHGLHVYDSGSNLGLLCITSMKIVHQANDLARIEVPLTEIINVKAKLLQMNYMTYPNDGIISIKCRIDDDIVCANFKVDSPEKTREEIEKARKNCCANNNTLKRSSLSRSSRILFKQ